MCRVIVVFERALGIALLLTDVDAVVVAFDTLLGCMRIEIA